MLAVLLGIGACGQQKSQPAGTAEKITLAAATGHPGSLVYIAEELGYFKNNGLEITINEYEAGKLAVDALLAGKADVATGSEFVFVSHSFDNPDLKTFGTIATAQTCKLISRKDHGIEKLGEITTVWPGQSGQDLYFLLITKEDWLKGHASTAQRLLKAFIQAEQFVSNYEQKAKDIIKNKFGYTSEYVDYYWAKLDYTVRLPQALLLAMEDQARWRIENKLTDRSQVPNYLDYIYTSMG